MFLAVFITTKILWNEGYPLQPYFYEQRLGLLASSAGQLTILCWAVHWNVKLSIKSISTDPPITLVLDGTWAVPKPGIHEDLRSEFRGCFHGYCIRMTCWWFVKNLRDWSPMLRHNTKGCEPSSKTAVHFPRPLHSRDMKVKPPWPSLHSRPSMHTHFLWVA